MALPSFGTEYCYEEVWSQLDFPFPCDFNSFFHVHTNLPYLIFSDFLRIWLDVGCIVPIFTGSRCYPSMWWFRLLSKKIFILLKSFLFHLFCSLSQKCQIVYTEPLFFFHIQYLIYNLFYVFVSFHFILGKVVKPAIIYKTVFSRIYSVCCFYLLFLLAYFSPFPIVF